MAQQSSTATAEAWPSEDTVWDAIRLTFDEKTAARLSFKRWKDGIDVDYPSSAAMLFAKQMFAEGIASAAQGAGDCGNLATGERENEETDRAYFEPVQGGKGEAVGYAIPDYFDTRRAEFEQNGTVIYHQPMGMATMPLYAAPQPASNAYASRDVLIEECAKIAETAYSRMFPKPANRITAENAGHAAAAAIRSLALTSTHQSSHDAKAVISAGSQEPNSVILGRQTRDDTLIPSTDRGGGDGKA